ncbi:MAG: PDZ domain-containing protein [Candidatus Obscuribacterales bacterium]|nr:PDZ domain-containing protein [Candidatus Obscuribacterales bacterium]
MKLSRIVLTLALGLTVSISAFGQSQADPSHLLLKEGGAAIQQGEKDKSAEPKIIERMGEPAPASPKNPFVIPLSPEALQALKGINADAQPTPAQLENIYQTVWQEVSDNYNRPEKLANWQEWKHKFDGKLKTPDELESALQEMLNSLDDHWTSYTSTADMKAARERYMNGILESGIFLKEGPEGSILIHSVAYGTAAYKSVLHKDDRIVKVNGVDVAGKTLDEMEDVVRGKAGSAMKVVYERDGAQHEVTLILTPPEQEGVQMRILPGHLGYIRLDEFSAESATKLAMGLVQLHVKANGHLNGLILDLRGNPGGRVDLAKKIAEIFIEKGTIFSTRTRKERQITDEVVTIMAPMEHEFADQPAELVAASKDYYKIPMVVLVDGSSASASEILTGALKDNGRATIMGTTTWGKGVGMIISNIPPGGRLSITSLDYLTPSGYNLSGKGIEPHIVVERHSGVSFDEQLDAAIDYLQSRAPDPFEGPLSNRAEGPNEQVDFFNSPLGISLIIALLIVGVLMYGKHADIQRNRRKEREAAEKNKKEVNRY